MKTKAGFRVWSTGDDAILRAQITAHGPDTGCANAAAVLGRTVNACKIRAVKLGIRKPDGTEHYKKSFAPARVETVETHEFTEEHETAEAKDEAKDDLVEEIIGSITVPMTTTETLKAHAMWMHSMGWHRRGTDIEVTAERVSRLEAIENALIDLVDGLPTSGVFTNNALRHRLQYILNPTGTAETLDVDDEEPQCPDPTCGKQWKSVTECRLASDPAWADSVQIQDPDHLKCTAYRCLSCHAVTNDWGDGICPDCRAKGRASKEDPPDVFVVDEDLVAIVNEAIEGERS